MQKSNPKIIVIPGSFSLISAYEGYRGIDIWIKNSPQININEYDWIIAHSAGINYLLSKSFSISSKLILINPLLKKRGVFNLLIRDIKFLIQEGTWWSKMISAPNWLHGFKLLLSILKIDVLIKLQQIQKDKIFIIRGSKDKYFCDEESAKLAEKNGWQVFQVEAGHNWNENIANKVEEIIENQGF